jgi:hypothetical protein
MWVEEKGTSADPADTSIVCGSPFRPPAVEPSASLNGRLTLFKSPWHPDCQAEFAKVFKHPMQGSTVEE